VNKADHNVLLCTTTAEENKSQ